MLQVCTDDTELFSNDDWVWFFSFLSHGNFTLLFPKKQNLSTRTQHDKWHRVKISFCTFGLSIVACSLSFYQQDWLKWFQKDIKHLVGNTKRNKCCSKTAVENKNPSWNTYLFASVFPHSLHWCFNCLIALEVSAKWDFTIVQSSSYLIWSNFV